MTDFALHHVSLVTSDLTRAIAFYRDKLGLRQIERPAFSTRGAWLTSGTMEVHLIDNPGGTFRKRPTIDSSDTHFAIRCADFEATMRTLIARGFSESAAEGDPMRITINRSMVAGYPQAYLLDPDLHVIEINAVA